MAGIKRGRRKTTLASKKESKHYRPDRNGIPGVRFHGEPVCPDWISETAQEFWAKNVPTLITAGVVAEVDEIELSAAAFWWATFKTLAILSESLEVEDKLKVIAESRRAHEEFSKIWAKYGGTPYDRQRLKEVNDPEKKRIGSLAEIRLLKINA